jgi:hypothetical protein
MILSQRSEQLRPNHFQKGIPPMLRSLLTAAAFAALATPAFAGTVFSVQFAEPVGKPTLSADSKVWACDGATCKAELDRKKPTVGTCKKLAKQAGKAVVAFTTPKASLSDTELAACAGPAK